MMQPPKPRMPVTDAGLRLRRPQPQPYEPATARTAPNAGAADINRIASPPAGPRFRSTGGRPPVNTPSSIGVERAEGAGPQMGGHGTKAPSVLNPNGSSIARPQGPPRPIGDDSTIGPPSPSSFTFSPGPNQSAGSWRSESAGGAPHTMDEFNAAQPSWVAGGLWQTNQRPGAVSAVPPPDPGYTISQPHTVWGAQYNGEPAEQDATPYYDAQQANNAAVAEAVAAAERARQAAQGGDVAPTAAQGLSSGQQGLSSGYGGAESVGPGGAAAGEAPPPLWGDITETGFEATDGGWLGGNPAAWQQAYTQSYNQVIRGLIHMGADEGLATSLANTLRSTGRFAVNNAGYIVRTSDGSIAGSIHDNPDTWDEDLTQALSANHADSPSGPGPNSAPQAGAGSEADLLAEARGYQIPNFDTGAADAAARAAEEKVAYQSAIAMRASMEAAARAGVSPEASLGRTAEIQQRGGIEGAAQSTQIKLQAAVRQFEAQVQDVRDRRAMAMDVYHTAHDDQVRREAYAQAERMLKLESDARIRYAKYMDSISPGAGTEFLKFLANVATAGVAGAAGALV